ncbi:MAG: hypothetical protein ACFFCW_06155 [Candidatus Hodarchaeota archaeon]
MAKDSDILAGLTSIIFTIDGQPICMLGKDLFESSEFNEPTIFFTGLLKGVRDFTTVFEMELRTVTAIGKKFLVKVLLSPIYTVESTIQRDLESIVLEERLTGKKPFEQMGWKKEDQTGFAIGFEVQKIPFYEDFPDLSRSLELHTLRKIAQTFYTDFADKIKRYDFEFEPHEVVAAIRRRSHRIFGPQIIDAGHPVYLRKMEMTLIQSKGTIDVEETVKDTHLSPYLERDTLGPIVTTIYTSMDALFNFTDKPNREGGLIIDFGGPGHIGYSLFSYGREIWATKYGPEKKTLVLCLMISEKQKYVLGGTGEIPRIMQELREKVHAKRFK